MHVLIADDDPVYQQLVDDLLNQWGITTTLVPDGEQAWDAFQRDKTIDVAILDWMMPGLDGFEVCQRIKQDPSREVYIILITGSRLKEEIIRVLIAGADDYIMKPFEALDLKVRLRNAMTILALRAEVAELRQLRGTRLPREAVATTESNVLPALPTGLVSVDRRDAGHSREPNGDQV